MQSFTSLIHKKYNLYYQTFFLLEICFSCTYYEKMTPIKMGSHRARLGENRHLPISRRSVLQKTAVFSTCTRSCARCWRKKLCAVRMRNAIQGYYLNNDLPLISISCSSDMGSPLIGSVPFSAIYFSISRLSNTQLDDGETQGCSGTSLLTTHKGYTC